MKASTHILTKNGHSFLIKSHYFLKNWQIIQQLFMTHQILYEDRTVVLTQKEVKIQNYYFFGVPKIIPISDIQQAKLYELTIWLKYRLAGGSYKYLWHNFPFDIRRRNKSKFIAFYLGGLWKPCVTPERPDQFFEALSKLIPSAINMIEKDNGQFKQKADEMQTLKSE